MKKALLIIGIIMTFSCGTTERLYQNETVVDKFKANERYYVITDKQDTIWVAYRTFKTK
jgi:hypothetical protein